MIKKKKEQEEETQDRERKRVLKKPRGNVIRVFDYVI